MGCRRVRLNAGSAIASFENQAEVVGRHLDNLGQRESGAGSNVRHSLHVAKTPLGILGTKRKIELRVALRGMSAVTTVGTVQEQNVPSRKQRLRAFEQCERRRPW